MRFDEWGREKKKRMGKNMGEASTKKKARGLLASWSRVPRRRHVK